MKRPDYGALNTIEVLVDGAAHIGTYRVVTGSVIDHYGAEVKFASIGMDRPDPLAKWLLTDLDSRAESGRQKRPRD